MIGCVEFDRLYAESLDLYDCSDYNERCNLSLGLLIGSPGTTMHIEATLVGMAVADPYDPDLRPLFAEINATDFARSDLRKIWAACASVANIPSTLDQRSLGYRNAVLERVVRAIWEDAKRPLGTLPEAATTAIVLSFQFFSAAGIRSIARHYQAAKAEQKLSGEIHQIAARLRAGEISATQCLDQFALLHERVSIHGH